MYSKLGVKLLQLLQPVIVKTLDKQVIHTVTHQTEVV